MAKVAPRQQLLRRAVPSVIIVVGLVLISVLVIQQVSAQESRTLKPPFKLVQANRTPQGPEGTLLPLNAPIILSQTFDSSYLPVAGLAQLGWHQLVGKDAAIGYTWKYAGTVPFTDTVWAAGTNPSGYDRLFPATDPYTNGMEAILAYGPLDMSDYAQAVFTMTYWLDTAPGDSVGVAVSTDGSNFTGVNSESISGTLSTTRTVTLNLSPYIVRQPTVWIAIYLKSDAVLPNGRGIFVHDVVLRGVSLSKNRLPLVMNNFPPVTPTFTPSPTPTGTPVGTYRYLYTFTNDTSTNNPDFNRWGGYHETNCGSGCTYYQDLVPSFGNPSPAFDMWLQGTNGAGGAGPRQNSTSLSTATNFEYSSDFYVYNGELNARYGLVFDASSGTFPGGGNPPMDPSVNYYLLELRMDTTTRTKVAQWQFVKVTNGARAGLTSAANLPFQINQGQWHNAKVVQTGTSLSFYLNGQFMGSTSYDSNWGDSRRRFGLYIDVRDNNGDGGGPFEYFADNIAVKDLP